MKLKYRISLFTLLLSTALFAQQTDTEILKTILSTYYKTEKPIYKGRNQLLYFYCEKPNNNEEIFETINAMKLPAATVKQIRKQVETDVATENWSGELSEVFAADKTNLGIKVNSCISLDDYHIKKKLNINNQRLLIVSKPVFYDNGNSALVKVVFYRSIEHNNGSILLFQRTGNNWELKDSLNPWST